MAIPLDQFRLRLKNYSRSELEQTFRNCVQQRNVEYAHEAKDQLDARYPGWDKPRTHHGGSKPTIARFRDKRSEFETAKAAYIWLVERFAQVNPSLFADVRWETTGYVCVGRRRGSGGSARNYFAKSPVKLFRRTPTLADNPNNYHLLTNGWYLNLNLNTRENFEILCRFSAVSQFKHDIDWDWDVLDPTEQLHDSRRRVQLAAELEEELFDEFLRQPPVADA
jgi:hypothetical protein